MLLPLLIGPGRLWRGKAQEGDARWRHPQRKQQHRERAVERESCGDQWAAVVVCPQRWPGTAAKSCAHATAMAGCASGAAAGSGAQGSRCDDICRVSSAEAAPVRVALLFLTGPK